MSVTTPVLKYGGRVSLRTQSQAQCMRHMHAQMAFFTACGHNATAVNNTAGLIFEGTRGPHIDLNSTIKSNPYEICLFSWMKVYLPPITNCSIGSFYTGSIQLSNLLFCFCVGFAHTRLQNTGLQPPPAASTIWSAAPRARSLVFVAALNLLPNQPLSSGAE